MGEKKVGKILEAAKKTLLALNVELRDEEAERGSPIALGIVDCGVGSQNDVQMAVGAGE